MIFFDLQLIQPEIIMNEINQIAEYLFSDLIKKGNYPYQKEIINTVRFLTG